MGSYSKEWLTEMEWRRVKGQEFDKWRDELLLKTLYNGAFRVSEIVGNIDTSGSGKQYPVKWSDDYRMETQEDGSKNAYIVLQTQKTMDDEHADPEQQPINPDIYKQTKRFMEAKERDTRVVFDSPWSDSLSRQRVNDILQEYVDRVGIDKKVGSHTLRRSRAKHLLENNMDLGEVSTFLRHDNIQTTMKYLNLAKRHLSDQAQNIDSQKEL